MRLNSKPDPIRTFEGGKATIITAEKQLRRSVMSCLLWEDEFYENGETVSTRISDTIGLVDADKVAKIAREAKFEMKLRHVPLFIAIEMLKHKTHKHLVGDLLAELITRADELAEVLAMYWKNGKRPLANQLKKGIAKAFLKFDEYALAKYNRDNKVKLRDALFLSHAKPKDLWQDTLWKKLINNTLTTPDTWEVAISATNDKKREWTRLLNESKLGGLAFLRNIRNMLEAQVDKKLITQYMLMHDFFNKILPFQYYAAAKNNPSLEAEIEELMLKALKGFQKLEGLTTVLVDVSGSMKDKLSKKSDLTRLDAACCLAAFVRGLSPDTHVFSFSDEIKVIPNRRGFALMEAIKNSQIHGGTRLADALKIINAMTLVRGDRIIIITDEQSSDGIFVPNKYKYKYLINVASAKNGVGYSNMVHIDGFSERVINFIQENESEKNN